MKKAGNRTTDDVQKDVPQENDGDSDVVEKKTEPETPNSAGTKSVHPDWLYGKHA